MRQKGISMDDIVVRQASSDDYDSIVRISKGTYNGHDHLIDIYVTCLENPNRCAQVAEWNGEIFGRCAEKARGKIIFRQLILREFAEFVYPKFPPIVRMRTSSVNKGHWDKKNDGTIIDMRRVIVNLCDEPIPRADFVRHLTPQRMAALRELLPTDSLSPVDTNTLNVILADAVSKKHFFPEGIIVSDSEVFDAHECNTSMNMQSCTACFVSGSTSSMYTSFSFGHAFTCPIGRLYVIDYYGTKEDSMFLAHISRHLPLAPDILKMQPVSFNVYVKEDCMGEATKRHFQEFAAANISPHGPPPLYLSMYSMTHPLPLPNSHL